MVEVSGGPVAPGLDQLVVSEYPYPIAVNYKRLLDTEGWQHRTRRCIDVFDYTLRTVTLVLISQYLILDRQEVKDSQLNELLQAKLARATLGTWNQIFFRTLQAYHGKRERFFVPELYDFYWDTSRSSHRKRKGIHDPFDRLIQIRNDLAHSVPPRDEEGWRVICQESEGLLREIFGHFTFLSRYDLIRIRRAEGGGKYWYDIYTGEQVASPNQPLTTEEVLTEGWLYLAKEADKSLLEMHPLLVFWVERVQAEQVPDTALFEKYQPSCVRYSATVAGESPVFTDRTLMAEFFYTVYHTLEKVKAERQEARKLTWGLLGEVAGKVTSERVGDVRSKYDRNVYLPRAETRDSFRAFLASDRTSLVLNGKSGVGKSNFFLSLVEEYEKSNEVCTLMYNGARLSTEMGLAEVLARDFQLYLKLEGLAEEGEFGDILSEIDRIEGIADKKVVLLIDALNENPDAKVLLRRVDALVEANPYPWLKVVISSRPETWRTIKRGVRLAEHKYYREDETDDLCVEMQPFGVEELRVAYANYQRAYKLQTDYKDVPAEVRQMLRDPLTLWLVAKTYQGQEIPEDLKVGELIERYIDALIETGRLYRGDIRFLEQELMPLMIGAGVYANAITGEMIDVARTADGKSLFELIYSDEVLSSGRRVNESFDNLVSAEILMHQELRREYRIAFKYERFYDFFGGKRFYQLFEESGTRAAFFEEVIVGEAEDKPFLLGPILNALLRALEKGLEDPVLELAGAQSPLVRDTVTEALTRNAERDRQQTRSLLSKLLARPIEASAPSSAELQRGFVATQVAGELLISEPLEHGIRSSPQSLRTEAARQVYLLWCSDRDRGWEILDRLIEEALTTLSFTRLAWQRIRGRSGLDLIESAGLISGHIMLNHYREEDIPSLLQEMWRPVLAKLLFHRGDDSLRERAVSRLRELTLSVLVNLLAGRTASVPARYNPCRIAEFHDFYKLPLATRQRAEALPDYLDPTFGDVVELERLIKDLYPTQDGLICTLIALVLVAQGQTRLQGVLRIAQSVFYSEIDRPQPGVSANYMIGALSMLARMQEPMDEDTFGTLRELVRASLERVEEWHSPMATYANFSYDDYLRLYVDKHENPNVDVLDWYTRRIRDEGNYTAMVDLLYISGRLARTKYWRVAMEQIRLLKSVDKAEVKEKMVDLLARVRAHEQEYVDEFLQEHFAESDVRQRVLVRSVEEDIMLTIGGGSGPWVDFIVKALNSDALRGDFIWIGRTAMCSTNFNRVLKSVVKWGVNKIYGGAIFQV